MRVDIKGVFDDAHQIIGAVVGDIVGNMRWFNERLEEESMGAVRALHDFGIGTRQVSSSRWLDTAGIEVNVNAVDEYEQARKTARQISIETTRLRNLQGLSTL